VSALDRRSDERDPEANAGVDADGLDDSPDATLVDLSLAAANDEIFLILGRFNLLLLEDGCGIVAVGFFSSSVQLIEDC
jgi:hypothetical protein